MIEYDPQPHGDEDDLTSTFDEPDPSPAETFSERHLPPLDDPSHPGAALPAELQFPGEPAAADVPVAGLEPWAPLPDDDRFSQWLADPGATSPVDDPAADAQLRDQLAAPPDGADGLPSTDALVEWLLRRRAEG